MAEVLLSGLLVLWIIAAIFGLARLVGLGDCMECGRACAPWDAYCWRHDTEAS
jgi:hypothetical protein